MGRLKARDLPDLSHLARSGQEIALRATPKASRDGITLRAGELRVSVTAPPENGKANSAIRALLAQAMGVAPSTLVLKRGQSARDKIFLYQRD